jgi:hypothetical protein
VRRRLAPAEAVVQTPERPRDGSGAGEQRDLGRILEAASDAYAGVRSGLGLYCVGPSIGLMVMLLAFGVM